MLETAGKGGEKVNFALEFTNNSGQAFYGKDGLVPVGGKFYLVGQLNADGSHAKVLKRPLYQGNRNHQQPEECLQLYS